AFRHLIPDWLGQFLLCRRSQKLRNARRTDISRQREFTTLNGRALHCIVVGMASVSKCLGETSFRNHPPPITENGTTQLFSSERNFSWRFCDEHSLSGPSSMSRF